MQLRDWFFGLFGRRARTEESGVRGRGPATHVIILDGTMSSLEPGRETNAGLTFKLLREASRTANLTVYYEAGIQWRDWKSTWSVMTGKGINGQIERGYGVVASRYRPGDKIVLIGYSRGAYAARSLAGVIDVVGLLQHDHATVRAVRQAYRHYRNRGAGDAFVQFHKMYCHDDVQVDVVAVWDTVRALGVRLPLVWRLSQGQHDFHNHALGKHVRNGFHALAIDERRRAFAPVIWECPPNWDGHMEQVWFRGNHADIGGQVWQHPAARPLSNIPLVWMLDRLETCGVPLPEGWRTRFPQDVSAPSLGNWRGWSKIFLARKTRPIGFDPSERLHETIADQTDDRSGLMNLHNQTSG